MNFWGVDDMMFNKKNWCIIATLSFIVSIGMLYLIKKLYRKRTVNPDKVLGEVKTYFMHVAGSYIVQQPLQYNKAGQDYIVYQGGITTLKNDTYTYYDFYADAHTGEILDIIEK